MPVTSTKHREHGRPRYQKGCPCQACVKAGESDPCRCTVCIEANRAYARRNARLRALPGGKANPATQPSQRRVERDPAKLVETQVAEELASLGSATQMKGLAAAVLAMARVLDDPTATPQHPGAAAQLRMLMKDIRAGVGGRKGKSRLGVLRGGRDEAAG